MVSSLGISSWYSGLETRNFVGRVAQTYMLSLDRSRRYTSCRLLDFGMSLSETEREVLEYIKLFSPVVRKEVADHFGVKGNTITGHVRPLKEQGLVETSQNGYEYVGDETTEEANKQDADPLTLGLADIESDTEPDPSNLTRREEYLAKELQTGVEPEAIAEELDTRESVIHQHLRDLKRQGWQVYIDESSNQVSIEGEHTLRSSEHTGTRTRKANKWWEKTHNELVKAWKGLELSTPDVAMQSDGEDWITHMTDLHAGDLVRDYNGDVVYKTETIHPIVEYISEQSLGLADKHGSDYDAAWILWGGDMVTNEAIYEGQYEDLDAWLDEQVDIVQTALLQQLKTFAARFPAVHVGAIAGNHGEIRASGSSKKANADLILYKSVRNTVAALQQEGVEWANKITFTIGQARGFVPLKLRGGKIHGQLRHGQDRKPQAETSARYADWIDTLMDTMNSDWGSFRVAWIGHHHVSGRIPWNGPPVFCSPSPKPEGEFVRAIGKAGPEDAYRDIATCHGVSNDGITGVYPIDTRHYERP